MEWVPFTTGICGCDRRTSRDLAIGSVVNIKVNFSLLGVAARSRSQRFGNIWPIFLRRRRTCGLHPASRVAGQNVTRTIQSFWYLLVLTFASAPCAHAAGAQGLGKLAQLPPAVQQTIRAQVGNGRITDITKTNENGLVVFEVEMRRGGFERSFTVAANGKLIALQQSLPELPVAAQQTIRAQIGSAQVLEIFWTDDDGEIVYEVQYQRGPTKRDLSVTPEGRLVGWQVQWAETPAAVQTTIRIRAGDWTVEDIHRVEEDGEMIYVVEVARGGRKRSFSVALDGIFLSEEVELTDTPAPVQRTIKAQVGNDHVKEIDRLEEAGEVSFEITVSRDGKKSSFIIAPDGALVSTRVRLSETPAIVQTVIKAKLGTATLLRIDKVTEGGETVYEVEARNGGAKSQFTVSTDGITK